MTKIGKTFGLLLIILLGQITIGQAKFNYQDDFKQILRQTKEPTNDLAFEKLLQRFQVNDTTMTDYEVLALMIGFTDKAAYKPYKDITTEREIYSLNEDEKYQEAIDKGLKFIETNPLSVKVLFELAYAYKQLADEDRAKFYFYKGQRIFEAMFYSGDGATMENAAFALGPADGQDFIYKFVGAKIGTMGSGRDKSGNFIDILEAKFEDGKVMNLYFSIQHATNKMFAADEEEEASKVKDKKKRKKQTY